MKLKNKTALVAGATRGIGLATARSLAEKNVRLVLPLHSDWPEDAKSVRNEFGNCPLDHIIIKADLRNKNDVTRMASTIEKKAGKLHILINNIERGGMPIVHGSYEREINQNQWQLELDTTLLAKKLVFESCLPLLKKARKATVINISSVAGIVGRGGPAGLLYSDGYAAANRAIITLTENWAKLGAPTIRVNEIMLGLVDTRHGENTRGWEELSVNQKKQLLERILLGRTGTTREIVEAIHFLICKGSYITGSIIRVDGGFVLGGEDIPPMPKGII